MESNPKFRFGLTSVILCGFGWLIFAVPICIISASLMPKYSNTLGAISLIAFPVILASIGFGVSGLLLEKKRISAAVVGTVTACASLFTFIAVFIAGLMSADEDGADYFARKDVQKYLTEKVDATNANLPRDGANHTLQKSTIEPGLKWVRTVKLFVASTDSGINSDSIVAWSEDMVSMTCSKEDSRKDLDLGITYAFRLQGSDGVELTRTDVTKEVCGQR